MLVCAGIGGFEGGSLRPPTPFSLGVCSSLLRGQFAFCPPVPHPSIPLHLLAPPRCVSIPAVGAVVASISRDVARACPVPLLHSARMSSLALCAETQLLGHAGAPVLARTIWALQCAQERPRDPRAHATDDTRQEPRPADGGFGSASFCWQALGAAHCHNARKAILRAVGRAGRRRPSTAHSHLIAPLVRELSERPSALATAACRLPLGPGRTLGGRDSRVCHAPWRIAQATNRGACPGIARAASCINGLHG